jgi:hypothetical protein
MLGRYSDALSFVLQGGLAELAMQAPGRGRLKQK